MRTCRTTLIAYALAGGLFLIIVTVPMSALSRSSQELGGQNSAAKDTADVRELAPGATIERELKRGEVHFYRIALASGQYLHAAVEQLNIDVVVKLLGPDNQQLAEANNWKSQDREQLSLVAEAPGEYRLEVRSVDKAASPGRYELRIEVLGTVTAEDKSRIAADRSFAEAERLRAQGTAESRRKAIEKYEEALPLWRSLGDRQEEGKTLLNIGVSYSDLGEIRKSLGYLDQALLLKRALGDRRREAITLSIIGESYWSLGDIPKALQYYDEALSVSRAIGYREGEALALNNQGVAYRDSGELGKALECYRQAGSIWGALGILGGESYMFQNIGSLYWRLGEDQKALEYFDQALSVRRALGARGAEAFTLTSIGAVYSSLGEPQKALEYYNQSLPFSREVGDRKLEGVALHRIGVAYSLLAEYQKALAYFDQAMLLRRAVGDRLGEAETLSNMGEVYRSSGDLQKALEYYGQGLALQRVVGDRMGEATTLYGIARVHCDRGQLDEAHAEIEAALGNIESVRSEVTSQELRASYIASRQDYYELDIDLLMQLGRHQPSGEHVASALQASERARARSLLETLSEARADIRQGVDPALLNRERALQQALNAKAERLTRLLSGKHTEEQAAAAKKEIELLLTDYQDVRARIRTNSPRYAELTQPQPLNLKEIQQQVLDGDTLLLEYSLGKDRSFLWAVTQSSLASYELPNREEIEKTARRVYELLTGSNKVELRTQAKLAAAELSRMVLGPVATQLTSKRLLIVADGALQYVPFSALPTPSAQNSKENGRPLIADHEIVSLPSASVLATLRRELAGRKSAVKTVAVLADPVLQSDDRRIKQAGNRELKTNELIAGSNRAQGLKGDLARSAGESGMTLERLRFTRQEADAIVALARGGDNLEAVDFDASKATATSSTLGEYRIVHFATHGLLNSEHPELSGVVLSLVDKQGQPQDGFMRLHDIYNLKLQADLVVLSACRTALGKEVRGEGLMGLTRGFMYAGAPRVVASLWDVKDEATAELMKRFYEGMLKRGLKPAAALRAAQVSMWKEPRWQAPYYWAAFVLQGEWK